MLLNRIEYALNWMSLFASQVRVLGLVAVALWNAGCATTTLDGSWIRPDFAGQRLQGPVLVVGVAHDATVRRIYEDEMVARLELRGVEALHSYELVPGKLEQDSAEALQQAARAAGATHLLSTAVIGYETETLVYQEPWIHGGWGGHGGWYGSYWGMAFPLYTDVETYSVYIAQTALTELTTDHIEWTARTRSLEPTHLEKETRAFVDVIVDALEEAGLLAAPSGS